MLEITPLRADDPPVLEAAFSAIGWTKPAAQFERYLEEQASGERPVFVARLDGEFAGYVTVVWETPYAPFREAGVPEIQDLNVLPAFRRRGIASALMDAAEALIATRGKVAGLGVGLYPDYGPAQRMYVLRGYVPDGLGVTYDRVTAKPGDTVRLDDELALHFTRTLES